MTCNAYLIRRACIKECDSCTTTAMQLIILVADLTKQRRSDRTEYFVGVFNFNNVAEVPVTTFKTSLLLCCRSTRAVRLVSRFHWQWSDGVT